MPDPIPSLQQLYSPSDSTTILKALLNDAAALKFPVTAWQALGFARTSLQLYAQGAANLTQVIALIARSMLLKFAANTDGTVNPWLTLVADNVYGVTRIPASFAAGEISISNASGSAYVIAVGDLHFANPTTGKTYTNTEGGTIAASGSLTLAIEADEIGSDSTSPADTITRMVTPLAGCTCNNADPVIGQDDESDPALVDRCLAKLGSLSPNGAADAYRYVALSTLAAGGRQPCTRVSVSPYNPRGQVFLYLGGPDGTLSGDDFTLVSNAVIALAVPNAVTPIIANAGINAPDIIGTVYLSKFYTGTTLQAQTAISTALARWMATLPIGGTSLGSGAGGKVFLDAIIAQIFGALTAGLVVDVALSAPTSDVSIDPSQAPVYGGTGADFTIVQLPG